MAFEYSLSKLGLVVALGVLWVVPAGDAQAQTPPDPFNYDRQSQFVYFEPGSPWAGLLKIERVESASGRADLCVETEYTYDSYGNKASATTRNCAGASAAASFTARTTSTAYSSYTVTVGGQAVTVPAGAFGRTATNALNHTETRVVDPRFGALTRLEGPSGIPTLYTLDDWGRVVEEVRADGTSTRSQYCLLVGKAADTSSNSATCGSTGPLSGNSLEVPQRAYSYVQTQAFAGAAPIGPAQRVYKDSEGRTLRQVSEAFDGGSGASTGRFIVQDSVYNVHGVAVVTSGSYFLDSGSANVTGSTNDRALTRTTVDALGRTTRIEQTTHATDPNGVAVSNLVGPNGSVYAGSIKMAVTTVSYSVLTTTTTNPLLQQRIEEKNLNGQLVRVTDATGAQIAYQHDAFGNLLTTKDALQNLVQLAYDYRGRKVGMIDPDTGNWSYAYNALGELVAQQSPRQTSATRTTMAYDTLGRMTQRIEPGDYTSNWYYDRKADGSTCMAAYTATVTPGAGKLCQTTTSHGVNKTFAFDNLGRPVGSRAAISGGPTFNTALAYDTATGRLQSQTYPTGLKVAYDYTTKGFLNQLKTAQQITIVPDAKPGETASAGTVWAANGILWSAGSINARGQAESQTAGAGTVAVNSRATYDGPTGRITALNAGRGTGTDALAYVYDWDSIGNLKTRNDLNGDGTTGPIKDTYVYDSINRLTQYTVEATAVPQSRVVNLQYNAIGNLLYKSDVGNYRYYPFGNASPVAQQPVHGVRGVDLVSGGSRDYTYDASGNAVTATAGAWRRITYTSFNLPNGTIDGTGAGGVENLNGLRYTWYYDENHQRLKEVRANAQGTRTTWYLHPDNQGGLGFETESTGSSTNLNRHYITAGSQTLLIVTREALAAFAGGGALRDLTGGNVTAVKVEFWHKDHLGSIVATTDHAGVVTARYSYDPYGKRRAARGSYDEFGAVVIDWVDGSLKGTDRGYTGHEHLDDIGIIHMNGRLFDPLLGRFLQGDPFIQYMDDLQSFNRYSYCFGNPVNCADPTGYFSLKKVLRITLAIVATIYLGPNGGAWAANGLFGGTAGLAGLVGAGNVIYAQAAIAGFVSGAISSGSVKGALQGAFSGVVFAGVGQFIKGSEMLAGMGDASRYMAGIALQGVAGCVTTTAGGGRCSSGALSAAFSKAISSSGFMDEINSAAERGEWGARIEGTLISAVAGGTASMLGGGKFDNGAMTAAFIYILNQTAGVKVKPRTLVDIVQGGYPEGG